VLLLRRLHSVLMLNEKVLAAKMSEGVYVLAANLLLDWRPCPPPPPKKTYLSPPPLAPILTATDPPAGKSTVQDASPASSIIVTRICCERCKKRKRRRPKNKRHLQKNNPHAGQANSPYRRKCGHVRGRAEKAGAHVGQRQPHSFRSIRKLCLLHGRGGGGVNPIYETRGKEEKKQRGGGGARNGGEGEAYRA
jgi:hypothetical protein